MNSQTLTNISQLFSEHKHIFVTGTDTEVGKTYCSALVIKGLQGIGGNIFPFKPISAGVNPTLIVDGKQINDDAYELWLACDKRYTLDEINPIVYQQPIAPHIAAKLEGDTLNFERLNRALDNLPNKQDMTLIEGAGGWLLPLNETQLMSSWVASRNMPVILVVGIKLGCLNHALLTAQAISHSGCKLIGWVANFIEGETEIGRENAEYLKRQFKQLHGVNCLFEVQRGQQTIV